MNAFVKSQIAQINSKWRAKNPRAPMSIPTLNSAITEAWGNVTNNLVRAAWGRSGLHPFTLHTTALDGAALSLLAAPVSDACPPVAKKSREHEEVWAVIEANYVTSSQEAAQYENDNKVKRKIAPGKFATNFGAMYSEELERQCEAAVADKVSFEGE